MLYIPYEKLINNNYHLIKTQNELNIYAECDKYFCIYYYKICYSLSYNCNKKDNEIFIYYNNLTSQIFKIKKNIVDINDIYVQRILIPITEYLILELEFNKYILNEIVLYNLQNKCNIIYDSFSVIKQSILNDNINRFSKDFLIYYDNLFNTIESLYLLNTL